MRGVYGASGAGPSAAQVRQEGELSHDRALGFGPGNTCPDGVPEGCLPQNLMAAGRALWDKGPVTRDTGRAMMDTGRATRVTG